MRWMTRSLLIVFLVIITGAIPVRGETVSDAQEAERPLPVQIGQKLFRGAANITTAWVEIPKGVYLSTAQRGPLIGIVLGTFNGIGMAYVRITGGVYETATFLIPFPWNYQPLVEPEYVWITKEDPESTL